MCSSPFAAEFVVMIWPNDVLMPLQVRGRVRSEYSHDLVPSPIFGVKALGYGQQRGLYLKMRRPFGYQTRRALSIEEGVG